ncbi:MAG TPA: malic enzyme-like NAD(P)-binding protein, partial [Blastocatellia bacterium]|nr:malic enzyme-like NAD(P)-binding protein [Blastocatellia bacterium]
TAVLGLGNIGPTAAIPVMEGKALLFKELAGIDAVPVCIDARDDASFVETVRSLAVNYAAINLEDIAAPRCFAIERTLQELLPIPVLHDDQKGTAVVVVAGVINALRVKQLAKQDAKVLLYGAGAAGFSVYKLLRAWGITNIVVLDSKGVICKYRDDLIDHKHRIATETLEYCDGKVTLADALVGRNIFIGLSKGNVLTKDDVALMDPEPVIFGLANPTPEIMPDEAYRGGALLVATGRSDFPNQINNALSYPGLFKAALTFRFKTFTEAMLITAAEAIANAVPNPTKAHFMPDLLDKSVPTQIVAAIEKSLLGN